MKIQQGFRVALDRFTAQRRHLLKIFVMFMSSTGPRPQECMWLRFGISKMIRHWKMVRREFISEQTIRPSNTNHMPAWWFRVLTLFLPVECSWLLHRTVYSVAGSRLPNAAGWIFAA